MEPQKTLNHQKYLVPHSKKFLCSQQQQNRATTASSNSKKDQKMDVPWSDVHCHLDQLPAAAVQKALQCGVKRIGAVSDSYGMCTIV